MSADVIKNTIREKAHDRFVREEGLKPAAKPEGGDDPIVDLIHQSRDDRAEHVLAEPEEPPKQVESGCAHCDDLDKRFAHLKSANTGAWQYRLEHGHWVNCQTQKSLAASPGAAGERQGASVEELAQKIGDAIRREAFALSLPIRLCDMEALIRAALRELNPSGDGWVRVDSGKLPEPEEARSARDREIHFNADVCSEDPEAYRWPKCKGGRDTL